MTLLTVDNLSVAFRGKRVVQGVSSASSKTTTAVARDSAVSITGPIHQGDLSSLSQAQNAKQPAISAPAASR